MFGKNHGFQRLFRGPMAKKNWAFAHPSKESVPLHFFAQAQSAQTKMQMQQCALKCTQTLPCIMYPDRTCQGNIWLKKTYGTDPLLCQGKVTRTYGTSPSGKIWLNRTYGTEPIFSKGKFDRTEPVCNRIPLPESNLGSVQAHAKPHCELNLLYRTSPFHQREGEPNRTYRTKPVEPNFSPNQKYLFGVIFWAPRRSLHSHWRLHLHSYMVFKLIRFRLHLHLHI